MSSKYFENPDAMQMQIMYGIIIVFIIVMMISMIKSAPKKSCVQAQIYPMMILADMPEPVIDFQTEYDYQSDYDYDSDYEHDYEKDWYIYMTEGFTKEKNINPMDNPHYNRSQPGQYAKNQLTRLALADNKYPDLDLKSGFQPKLNEKDLLEKHRPY